ncbi:unnamed protein product [Phytophthora fragariaefolia]|uniref:Unnamed protein product n=1 Tax=Phytophthora fragariaefolia TaxID=1490495 RepID=A0A9W7D6D7_9STRA|nr:unnamed protein product [Phytophthora fragariaefolia]
MFRNNIEFHSSIRKTKSDRSLADGGPPVENFDDEWAMLADKGYQGLAGQTRYSHPKKGRNLSRADLQFNDDVSSDRVIVENVFGRLCTLWRVCADKYRWGEEPYDDIFQSCASLTNFHIETRMEAAVVNAGASVAELLAWSSHLAVCGKEKPKPSQEALHSPKKPSNESKIIQHQSSVIDQFWQHIKRQDERMDNLEAKMEGAPPQD